LDYQAEKKPGVSAKDFLYLHTLRGRYIKTVSNENNNNREQSTVDIMRLRSVFFTPPTHANALRNFLRLD
jgi:hypothetical protein